MNHWYSHLQTPVEVIPCEDNKWSVTLVHSQTCVNIRSIRFQPTQQQQLIDAPSLQPQNIVMPPSTTSATPLCRSMINSPTSLPMLLLAEPTTPVLPKPMCTPQTLRMMCRNTDDMSFQGTSHTPVPNSSPTTLVPHNDMGLTTCKSAHTHAVYQKGWSNRCDNHVVSARHNRTIPWWWDCISQLHELHEKNWNHWCACHLQEVLNSYSIGEAQMTKEWPQRMWLGIFAHRHQVIVAYDLFSPLVLRSKFCLFVFS